MHVILVNDSSDAWGGATKVFLNCIDASLRDGHEVTAFVGDTGAHIRRTHPAARVIALHQSPLRDGVSGTDIVNKTFGIRSYRALREVLATSGSDTVVHVHGWAQILSPSIFYALRDCRAPVLVTAHDFFLACPNGAFVDFATGKVCRRKPLSLECLATDCDKRNYLQKLWRAQRHGLQELVGAAVWSNVTVLLAHEKMSMFLRSERYRATFTLRSPTKPFVPTRIDAKANEHIVFLGRVTWEKGADVVAQSSRMIDSPLMILGRGILLDHVRREFPAVHCPGWVSDEELSGLLTRARIFLMPSRMPEPYGLVAIEAMMSGLPIIVSRNCLIADEIEASEAGLVVEPNEPVALAAAIRRLAKDDELVSRMSERAYALGHSFADEPANWERRLLGFYRTALDGTRGDTAEVV